jgi:predicted permease
MRALAKLRLRLRSLLLRDHVESDLSAELRFHLDQQIEENLAAGMAPDAARKAALRTIGGIAQFEEECRDMRGVNVTENLAQDLRYAARAMGRSRAFTAVAVLSLALGIGANTAIFSVLHAVTLRLLPVQHPAELVEFHRGEPGQLQPGGGFSYPIFERLRADNRTLAGMAAVSLTTLRATGTDGGEGVYATGNFYELLGVRSAIGRTFTEADTATPVSVIGYGYWQRVFGGDPGVLGKTLIVEGKPFTIVGVSARGFTGVQPGRMPDFAVPMAFEPYLRRASWLKRPGFNWMAIVGRLKGGVGIEQAQANLDAGFKQFLDDNAGQVESASRERFPRQVLTLSGGGRGLSGLRYQYAKPLYLLMAVAGAVLLLACVNLANLLLARASARRRELAIRVALGAGRGRIVSQLMIEALLLAIVGGGLGIAFARWTSKLLLSLLPGVVVEAGLNGTVLGFTVGVCVASALLFGLGPALRAARVQPGPDLKAGMSGKEAGSGGRLRALFVVTQVAVSLILVVGATLFSTSLRNLLAVDPGFQGSQVVMTSINPGRAGYQGPRLATLYEQIVDRVRHTPGIKAASLSMLMPISGAQWDLPATVEGYPGHPGEDRTTLINGVSAGYFDTLSSAILLGRDFNEHDAGAEAPRVLLINETMARRYFAGANPIGKRVKLGDQPFAEIVGVVKDAKYDTLRETVQPTAYVNCLQLSPLNPSLTLAVRASVGLEEAAPTVRAVLKDVEKNMPVGQFTSLAEQVGKSLMQDRLMATLSGLFGGLALAMASVGLYGVLAYSVARRTREIGIRMALGSNRSGVWRLVMREVLLMVGVGIAVGLPAAMALGQYAAAMLYGLRPSDPWALTVAAMVMLGVAVVAASVPARRASRVDPMVALRFE